MSESGGEERIVGSETLSTSSTELSDKSDSPLLYSRHINVKVRPKENTGFPASETVTCHAEQEEKRKKE